MWAGLSNIQSHNTTSHVLGQIFSNSADKCNARWKLGLLKESKFGNRALSVLWYLFMYFSYSQPIWKWCIWSNDDCLERFIVFLIMACDHKSFWLAKNLTREMGKSYSHKCSPCISLLFSTWFVTNILRNVGWPSGWAQVIMVPLESMKCCFTKNEWSLESTGIIMKRVHCISVGCWQFFLLFH